MTLADYRNTQSWQEAIELGPMLARLADELPAAEAMGMGLALRRDLIKLPSAVAIDLVRDDSNLRFAVAVRVATTLELIERVYPAIEVADIQAKLATLTERLASPEHFDERLPAPAPEPITEGPGEPADDAETDEPESVAIIPPTQEVHHIDVQQHSS